MAVRKRRTEKRLPKPLTYHVIWSVNNNILTRHERREQRPALHILEYLFMISKTYRNPVHHQSSTIPRRPIKLRVPSLQHARRLHEPIRTRLRIAEICPFPRPLHVPILVRIIVEELSVADWAFVVMCFEPISNASTTVWGRATITAAF